MVSESIIINANYLAVAHATARALGIEFKTIFSCDYVCPHVTHLNMYEILPQGTQLAKARVVKLLSTMNKV